MAWTVSSLYKTDGTHCIVKRHEVIVTSYRLSRWFLRFGSGNFLKGEQKKGVEKQKGGRAPNLPLYT